MKNKKVCIVPMIAVLVFMIIIFTAGYAYFTASINVNKSYSFKLKVVELTGYTGGSIYNSGSQVNDTPFVNGTGTIYRNTTDSISIGDNISLLTSGYETDLNDIGINSEFLKHEVENRIVQASYACVKYTESGVLKEACIRGGSPSYYGTYNESPSTIV